MHERPASGWHYLPGFLPPAQAGELHQHLLDSVCWQREQLRLYGRHIEVPRLLTWCGDPGLNYRYSGTDHVCHGWLDVLQPLKDQLARHHGLVANLVLVNRYRHGGDYMGWHKDDERGHGRWVASVSLGARRRFLLRPPGTDRSVRLDLEPGSLLLMDSTWRHALPKTRRPVNERINLSFRRVETAA
jgi:alkylated DNA repair dioxygenase AlkB